jgi:cardiolipin synthase
MPVKTTLSNLNVANQLTFLRLVAVPFFIISILQGRFGVATILFIGAGLTDILDGLIARWFNQGTALGAYLDPAADKLLLTSAFVLLTQYPKMFQEIDMVARLPIWLTILTISRDVFIVAIVAIMYLAYGRTAFPPSFWGKMTTLSETVTVSFFLLFNYLHRDNLFLDMLVWLTLSLTLISGFHYLALIIKSVSDAESGTTSQVDDSS